MWAASAYWGGLEVSVTREVEVKVKVEAEREGGGRCKSQRPFYV